MGLLEVAEYIGAVTTIVAALKWLLGKFGRIPDLRSLPGATHSFSHEIAAIVPLAVLLNLAGALFATVEDSIFLDMVGTLVAAIVLGPWWGALVGLLTGMTMHWLVTEVGLSTDLQFLPFAMVQVAGAFYWGLVSRIASVQTLLSSAEENVGAFARAILILGVGGGLVTGATSAWVYEVVVSDRAPAVALQAYWANQIQKPAVLLREIAGKISSVVVAALVVRSLFPVFLRASAHQLIRSGLLPVAGLTTACSIYAVVLAGEGFIAVETDLWPRTALAVWPIAAPILFLLREFGTTDIETPRRDRIQLYGRLAEVARPADRTFRVAALLSILGAFLAMALALDEVTPRQLALRMAAVIGFLLMVTWSFEVAAQHNRLDQLLVEEERGGGGSPGPG